MPSRWRSRRMVRRLAVAFLKHGIALLVTDDGEHMEAEGGQIGAVRRVERIDRVRFDARRVRVDQALRLQRADELARRTVAMQRLIERRGAGQYGR